MSYFFPEISSEHHRTSKFMFWIQIQNFLRINTTYVMFIGIIAIQVFFTYTSLIGCFRSQPTISWNEENKDCWTSVNANLFENREARDAIFYVLTDIIR